MNIQFNYDRLMPLISSWTGLLMLLLFLHFAFSTRQRILNCAGICGLIPSFYMFADNLYDALRNSEAEIPIIPRLSYIWRPALLIDPILIAVAFSLLAIYVWQLPAQQVAEPDRKHVAQGGE